MTTAAPPEIKLPKYITRAGRPPTRAVKLLHCPRCKMLLTFRRGFWLCPGIDVRGCHTPLIPSPQLALAICEAWPGLKRELPTRYERILFGRDPYERRSVATLIKNVVRSLAVPTPAGEE